MLDLTTPRGRIIAAALNLAKTRPWRDITLSEIADDAGMPLSDLAEEFSNKTSILLAFMRAVDKAVLKSPPKSEDGQETRDRIFEVLMNRFDILQPYKDALKRILWSTPLEPRLTRKFLSTQHWMLEAAGVTSEGPLGLLKVSGLAGVYARVFKIWLDDDDPGLGRTMAALDKRLRRGEDALTRISDICSAGRTLACALAPRGSSRASRTDGDAEPQADPSQQSPPQPAAT
jgi:AcrR family transcriptional regulator